MGNLGADPDVLLLGGGGAGLAILHQLAARATQPLSVGVIDPVNRLAVPRHDRTWCFWLPTTRLDDGWVGQVALARWRELEVVTRARRQIGVDLGPLEYVMVTSDRYAQHVAEQVDASPVEVTWIEDPEQGAGLRGRWEFDSRPVQPDAGGLWQNFVGEFRRFTGPAFEPGRATLMDFAVPQSDGETSFGYVLPVDEHNALVEYTRFTPARLDRGTYQQQLDEYLAGLGLGESELVHSEHGEIPMSAPARVTKGSGNRFTVGTAGGATRAATGYTFAAMQRQAAGIAAAVLAGRTPVPPPAYPHRHRVLDRVMLQALHDGLSGPEFFCTFFETIPGERALNFLDGTSSVRDDVRVVAAIPPAPMLAASARLVLPLG